jgi:hypothetical protein
MRYAIRVGKDSLDLAPEAYLDWDPRGTDGLVVRNTTRSGLLTTWVLVDRGPSTLAG